ncbi:MULTISPECIES: SDR family NAD(P)-dependent oxidoreductase [Alteromonas]|uniref:Polysaccharide biosynthesis family protein n=1 Tax=Alteromonas macleodii TaxID=28108 RepID=A0AB36FRL5_ALTMA|nr:MULTISPECIES: SDR family NAD(P)-dependent oxidoreductase [Alteromonas]MCP4281314.1 SDR family oxidoreductase [Alteromonas sp.]OES28734.1 polysaccharide biosynthesis family protein [Alteromonas macleodii]OES28770.1 polysaccharide biosynthesis family protein [Alteromonas macleodii]OES29247.1 polysaccharide biosynthesis family protein [Alteromonas macleodii]OES40180.1 polysaccharide biosynthesis family protein [Alteromonas macleodii]
MAFSQDLLKDKTILVTGAGKGIGKACALLADACGANVIAVARTESDLVALKNESSERLSFWVGDVQDKALYEKIQALPLLHGLINNAGTNRVAPMQKQSDENIDDILSLNIRSAYKVAQAAITPMLKSQAPSIVHMSSQMGFVGSPGRTLYCLSKHAIEGLTKAMAVELAPNNIRVNSVAPTFIKTPMTEPMLQEPAFAEMVMNNIPLQRLGSVEDVANACIFLLSELSMTTTGSCLKVDGGWTAH